MDHPCPGALGNNETHPKYKKVVQLLKLISEYDTTLNNKII